MTRDEVETILAEARGCLNGNLMEHSGNLRRALERFDGLKRESLKRETWRTIEYHARRLKGKNDDSFRVPE